MTRVDRQVNVACIEAVQSDRGVASVKAMFPGYPAESLEGLFGMAMRARNRSGDTQNNPTRRRRSSHRRKPQDEPPPPPSADDADKFRFFDGDKDEASTERTAVERRHIYTITMRYSDERRPEQKDFAGMILEAIEMQSAGPTTRARSNEKRKVLPVGGDTAWGAVVENNDELVKALETVGTSLVEHKRANDVAIVVLSVHGWVGGVSVHRHPAGDADTMGWKEVMGRLQAARWTALGVLLVIDCCKGMSDLPEATRDATLKLTERLGLSGLATDVIAAGYVDGSGDRGWEASAECCIAGIKAAWNGDWTNMEQLASIVEESADACGESASILGGFRCLPLGLETAQQFAGDYGGYGFYQTTLSEAARTEMAECVSKTTLARKTAFNVHRWEVQWFQKEDRWWNPRDAIVDQLSASGELGAIATKFCTENEAGLRVVFDDAPEPYKTIYDDNRLLGHISAQYFDGAVELIAEKTLHMMGQNVFLVCASQLGSCRGLFLF